MNRDGVELIEASTHHSRRHAAAHTSNYLFSQLIPYIGNKRKLLPLIAEGIRRTGITSGSFVDLFTGSTVVARFAKTLGFRVLANDWEPYAYEIAGGTVACNVPPSFAALGGPERVFDRLNSLPPFRGYVSTHLCPVDDDHPDTERERMFFTQENGRRIDAIREQVRAWELAGLISNTERSYVLGSLCYAVSYTSNTSGVFKGFHRGWGGKTGTALYRIRSRLTLKPPVLFDNGAVNLALRDDAQTLAGGLADVLGGRPDLVYIDPPYNQHPYGSNYHVLNTVVLWDKPALNASIAPNGRPSDKSAIRRDWRTERRSPYNFAAEALPALSRLAASIDARWILMSYSTDGHIPVADVLTVLAQRGRVQVFTQRYKRYRVSTPRMSPRSHNVEFAALVDTRAKDRGPSVSELTRQIANARANPAADA